MCDLTCETPISLIKTATLFAVHRRTVEGWFDRGLDNFKLGGLRYTTREALNRFKRDAAPIKPEAVIDSTVARDMADARRALRR